jgi:hypothetical protein
MADDPQRARTTAKPADKVISYEFLVEIEVKTPVLDEKRLAKLVDDRFERLAATLKNRGK